MGRPAPSVVDESVNSWMTKCIEDVKKKSNSKDVGRAISACQAQLKKMRGNTQRASVYMRLFVMEHIDEDWVLDPNSHVPVSPDDFEKELEEVSQNLLKAAKGE